MKQCISHFGKGLILLACVLFISQCQSNKTKTPQVEQGNVPEQYEPPEGDESNVGGEANPPKTQGASADAPTDGSLAKAADETGTVSKDDWINSMTSALPAIFCKDDTYFRKCFDLTAEDCEKSVLSITRICIEKLKGGMPPVFSQPRDGEAWGSKLGSCVGDAFVLSAMDRQIDSEQCNDPLKWQ